MSEVDAEAIEYECCREVELMPADKHRKGSLYRQCLEAKGYKPR